MTPCTVCDQARLLVAKMRIATQKTTKVRTRTLHPQFFKKLFVHGTTRALRGRLSTKDRDTTTKLPTQSTGGQGHWPVLKYHIGSLSRINLDFLGLNFRLSGLNLMQGVRAVLNDLHDHVKWLAIRVSIRVLEWHWSRELKQNLRGDRF